MTGGACKAAICANFTKAVSTSVDLILGGHISEEGIDEFIEMSEKMEKKVKKWEEKYVPIED